MQRRASRLFRHHALSGVLVAYVSGCVILGGAGREGFYGHGVLQAIAGLGLAALIMSWPSRIRLEGAKTPIAIFLGIIAIGVLQSIPLPSGIWQMLPGRSLVAEGFERLGQPAPALPISLDVEATFSTLGYVLTPLFVIVLSARIGMRRLRALAPWFLSILGVCTVIYGLFQVFDGRESSLYLYEFTSKGLPVGFFSNVNHQASLMLMVFPFTLYLLSELGQDWRDADGSVALAIVIVAMAFMILVGLFGAGSVGGYAILGPIALLGFLASRKPGKNGMGRSGQIGVLVAFALGALLVASSPVLEGIGVTSFSNGEGSRYSIWNITVTAIGDHWLLGSGLGTYESVIPLYENPDTVTATFVAKAHNDYLQIIMEGGLLGGALLLFSLFWFGQTFLKIWGKSRGGSTQALRKFAFVALFAVMLHSIVDYPARTPAIAAVFGLCVALVTIPDGRGSASSSRSKRAEENTKRVVL